MSAPLEMRPEDATVLLDTLRALRGADGRRTDMAGICYNAERRLRSYGHPEYLRDLMYGYIEQRQRAWPHYSREPDYPVPATVGGMWAGAAYDKYRDLWNIKQPDQAAAEYARLRRDLLEFLIEGLET